MGQWENSPVPATQPVQKHHFAPVLLRLAYNLTLLFYSKVVKIAAIGSMLTTKVHQNAFGRASKTQTSHLGREHPFSPSFSTPLVSQFPASYSLAPLHAVLVVIIKSRRLWLIV